MGHLVVETFAISHHNAYNCPNKKLKGNPLIGDLLRPHFTDLIALNTAARVTLIAPLNNQLETVMAVPGEYWGTIIAQWYSKQNDFWNTDVGFVQELKKRGFNVDLDPNTKYQYEDIYRFLKDGKKQNIIIHKYVSGVIHALYANDKDIQDDELL